jgi:hypothetical protein
MTLDDQIRATELDLQAKLSRRDWHGVSDAANDLRVLEAQRDVRGTRPVQSIADTARELGLLRPPPVCPHCKERHESITCPVRG